MRPYERLVRALAPGALSSDELVRWSLPLPERAILDAVRHEESSEEIGSFALVIKDLGARKTLELAPRDTSDGEAKLLLSDATRVAVEARVRRAHERATQTVAWSREFLRERVGRDRACRTLRRIHAGIPHMGPLIFFAGRQQFSTSRQWGGALAPGNDDNKLLQLVRLPMEDWNDEDCWLASSLFILEDSGGLFRLEGANYMQLDPVTLSEYLCWIASRYHLSEQELARFRELELAEKAAWIRVAHDNSRDAYILARSIDGASWNRQVFLVDRAEVLSQQWTEALREAVVEFLGSPVIGDPAGALNKAADAADCRSGRVELLTLLVRAGLMDCGADVFMARGPRNLTYALGETTLAQADFFCLVEAKPERDATDFELPWSLDKARWNIAKRMCFNSWKFWHGNLGSLERDPGQYYWFPPTMPDIARSEDAVHAGHAANGVRASIRASGSLVLKEKSGGPPRSFEAVYDVRAMLCSRNGEFNRQDFCTALRYRDWLGIVMQRWADSAASTDRLPAFDRDYYCNDAARAESLQAS